MSFEEKLKRIADERERLAAEEAAARAEALEELDRLDAEIANLEERKAQIEAFLGVDDTNARAAHGQILQLCIKAISEHGGGMTSSQIKDLIANENPGLKLSSVPSTLSRLALQGRIRKDEMARYYLA
jgi:fatty acid-binding protein DegV